jgi:hypothetical protein
VRQRELRPSGPRVGFDWAMRGKVWFGLDSFDRLIGKERLFLLNFDIFGDNAYIYSCDHSGFIFSAKADIPVEIR